jgi:hypothetical protein
MMNTTYGKLTTGLIADWFAFSLFASASHWFRTESGQPPLPLLLAVLVPIGAFLLWYRNSKSFREFVLSLSPRTLTVVHAWRMAGFGFLALYAYGILPGYFALPAGWGDVAIGATAIMAMDLANPNHRSGFVLWHLLGIADLVTAIGAGAVAGVISPQSVANAHQATTAPMTALPLSVIPTFAVPLFLIFHMICIEQATRWPKTMRNGISERVDSLAA